MKYTSDSLDKLTGGIKMIDTDHSYIHQGVFFSLDDIVTIATGASVYFGYVTPSDTSGRVHYRPGGISTSVDKCTINFYENAVFSTGTVMPSRNHLRESTRTGKMLIYKSPTVTTEGNLIQLSYIPGSTGTGGTRSGGFSSVANEWVLKPGTKYLAKITNGSASSMVVGLNLQWYEEGY